MRSLFIFIVMGLFSAQAQVINSWTNATSSYWEFQTNWSLGIRPDQSQSVCITNAGFKAVAIGPNTAQNFPTSMQIQGLQISTPSNSFNELLMNFSGFQVPLQITGLSVYGTNSSIVLQSSMLRLVTNGTVNSGNAFIGGIISQGDFSRVEIQGFLSVGRYNPYAAYYLTNGALNTPFIEVGFGLSQPAKFVQYGGTNNAGTLQLNTGGEYDLYGGEINSSSITDGGGDYALATSFYQYGGTVTGNMVVNGNYTLNGGTRTGFFSVAAGGQRVDASVIQTGGTNAASSMELGHPNQFGGAAYYTLSNGVVRVDSSTSFGGGQFSQYNGQHTIASNLFMQGPGGSVGVIYSDYFLAGGTLSIGGGLTLNAAHFDQIGGTNSIAGTLLIGPIPPSQSTGYALNGGTLNVRDIEIHANTYFSHTSGNIAQSGTLILGQGEWDAANGDYTLGPLQLAAPDPNVTGFHTNSAFIFPSGSSILHLANSSAQTWAANAILYITNWNGSASGGGATQLYFGSNSSGLTSAQLAQTIFANPGGLPAGNYSGKLLSTGELVPNTGGGGGGGSVVNNWTNPASGRWDSAPNWSLATLPASNHTVNITNAGYKAVNVDNATFANFPASVTVSNLTVSAPTNGLSTLLLNYAGLGTPLKVLNDCVIGTNGTIDNFSSSFEVDGSGGGQLLVAGGNFTQVGGQTVVNAPVSVSSGSVNDTNGNMTLGNVTLGTSGNFNQSGGSIAAASLSISQGNYNLYDGILYALGGTAFPAAGTFNQYGGTNFGDVYMNGYPSAYRLLGGLLRGTNITASYSSIFCQGGGEAQAALVTLTGQSYQTTPNYFLTNGVLRVGTLGIYSCSFLQMNGQVIITNPLSIYGYDMPVVHTGDFVYFANYTMQAGTLNCPSLTVTQYSGYVNNPFASFTQNAGTNIVAGNLSVAGATYSLAGGGLLQTSNSVIANGTAAQGVGTPAGVFQQRSGTHTVTGTLSIYPGNRYQMNGGTLSAGAMSVHAVLAIGNSNGTPTVFCSGLFDLGSGPVLPGAVQVQVGTHHLGSLKLSGNAGLNFGNGSATINFDSSSSIGWSNGVSLVISNWNNSVHIFFGNNASGLTASQLAQIQFSNPGGFSPGNYGAQLLSTGELVPVLQPTLQSARYGSALVLTWPGGYQLLSATNVTGPYAPVNGATSPWTNTFSKPREFFKLQGL